MEENTSNNTVVKKNPNQTKPKNHQHDKQKFC